MSSTACAQVVVEELISFGVREAVLAPGSRDAPLAYELFEADKIGLLRLHVRIDERSAAFTALGMAKASGLPVPVITTSGTAAGNLHPAVMEAWHSRIPLIAITADRPLSMIDTGANQTTRQRGLFAGHVRSEVQVTSSESSPRAWRFAIQRALVAASGRRSMIGGPAHINIAFDEPLVPEPIDRPEEDFRQIDPVAVSVAPTVLPSAPQTVIIAGDLPPEEGHRIAHLAERAAIPLLAEPSSNARRGPAAIGSYRLLLQSSLTDDIERVVVVGHPTLSRPVSALMRRPDLELIVVDGSPEWADPAMNADRVLGGISFDDSEDRGGVQDGDWLSRWQQADHALRPKIDELITTTAADGESITGPTLAATLWRALGEDDQLFVGSSNPVRDLDLAPIGPTVPQTYANRGLAGIDGALSTAAGIALASDRPTHALVGDLTFLHDAGGLIVPTAEPRPGLRIVVANDDGGSIFATLEQGHPAQMGAFERVFGVGHGTDLSGLAAAVGAGYLKINSVDQLTAALRQPPSGIEVLDVIVDRRHRRTLDQQLNGLAATL
ncbi:2-succinyl-5-enolpyruvyl-6-hydroxy-3-cyclohexene-1-carboxylic-acid synthase [Microlunatus soli]|uniref:2-succinyl-5-enolpyruvyl-6-hydroxy-3-cyclohexene-1-carboxylate synthase n=1 Tax=Microlunatus soli TaxID=630515 RepID=A0A1H1W0S4_9ACTN|nr:2-succinyl-5-enolpyruvyl-6-hydroxy-3-cyclohexene-1-carboxylic-acid synthase [Microlunatus soli]SDS90291.1 2-succinyl-5-enolpyruvyl-6-hydroxy-3-cyclohexene-1-carboxylate synthase [Microlunatus soli]